MTYTPSVNNHIEVQFLKTDTGFELYSDISALYVFFLLIRIPILLSIVYLLVNDYKPEHYGQLVLISIVFAVIIIMAIYYSTARQFVILSYPKLKIGISIGRIKIQTKSVDYRNIYGIKYFQKEDADFANVILELNNTNGQKDPSENISFGKYLTLDRCKKIAWHLNNYLNGVA